MKEKKFEFAFLFFFSYVALKTSKKKKVFETAEIVYCMADCIVFPTRANI